MTGFFNCPSSAGPQSWHLALVRLMTRWLPVKEGGGILPLCCLLRATVVHLMTSSPSSLIWDPWGAICSSLFYGDIDARGMISKYRGIRQGICRLNTF